MNNKKLKISFILNLIIGVLTIIASIIMFTGFKFMTDYDLGLQSTKLGMLKFFTVQSNILMGVIALIFAYKEFNLLKGKKIELTKKDYLLKLAATTSVALTFIVVFTYLGPITKYGIKSMLTNSNLFYHLIIPVLSIITLVFFEKNNKIKFNETIYGLVPSFIYSLFYTVNVLIHMENGKVSPIYDWYWFVQNGVWTTIIVAPVILAITYLICLALWKLNKSKEI